MERGIIRVNGERVNDDYVLDGSERIQLDGVIHLERPVPCPNMIEFIHEDENYLVVNKPSCIPVAPGEPFFKNSLIHILEDDYYKTDLKPCHRLDKGTTGVCIFAKTRNAAAHFATMLKSHRLRKYYITRVHGEFKSDTKIVVIDKPVLGNDRRHTVEAKTFVSLLFFESETNTSLLVCAPVTGRYHQIRQHLWDYGYPIVHDHEIKKTQSVTEARNYPWEWDTKELARCNNNVQQYIDERFERQQKEFFESRQFEMIQLHAFRYEHVEDETILWRYETKNLPSWAHDVDREQLNDIVCEIAKLSNIQQVEEVDDVTREVSALDKYYCMSKECTKHAKEIKTAELLYQKWNRPLRSEECTYHCTKHGQQVTSNCIICNQDILWKKCNYCQKCKNDLDALTT